MRVLKMSELCSGVLGELRKRWFIVSLVSVIVLARSYPYLGCKDGKLVH